MKMITLTLKNNTIGFPLENILHKPFDIKTRVAIPTDPAYIYIVKINDLPGFLYSTPFLLPLGKIRGETISLVIEEENRLTGEIKTYFSEALPFTRAVVLGHSIDEVYPKSILKLQEQVALLKETQILLLNRVKNLEERGDF